MPAPRNGPIQQWVRRRMFGSNVGRDPLGAIHKSASSDASGTAFKGAFWVRLDTGDIWVYTTYVPSTGSPGYVQIY